MLIKLFDSLTQTLYSTSIAILIASFIWGVLSIVLSPCHLSSIPLLIAYIGGQGKLPVKKAFILSLFFSFGLLITIALIGLVTGILGRILGDIGIFNRIFVILVAMVFFLFALNFLGVLPDFKILKSKNINIKKKGLLPSFLIGILFGTILGPCTFGFMAPILAVVFSTAKKNITLSILILIFFAIGHCIILILAGTFTEIVQKYINWNEKSKSSVIIKRIFGVFMIILAIYLIISNYK